MADLPETLRATATTEIVLPSGQVFTAPMATPKFEKWHGAAPAFTYGGKPLLVHDGKPLFAELLILRLLQSCGWSGVWVEVFGGKRSYLREMPIDWSLAGSPVELPSEKSALLDAIQLASGGPGGTPDVYAWHGDSFIFCEAKRRQHDKLQPSQARWIEAALACGIPTSALLIVEWSYLG
jgi:hypothetical protein